MNSTTALIGYLGSGLVLATFATSDLRRLRIIGILSNISFILLWRAGLAATHPRPASPPVIFDPGVRLMGLLKAASASRRQ
jgi:hypothetical protein